MLERIRTAPINLARRRKTWSYSQLNDQLELGFQFRGPGDGKQIGDMIGDISIHEHGKGRPLLSSLIIHQNDKKQGDGFYKLCASLDPEGRHWENLKKDQAWEDSIKEACFAFWADEENFQKFKDDY